MGKRLVVLTVGIVLGIGIGVCAMILRQGGIEPKPFNVFEDDLKPYEELLDDYMSSDRDVSDKAYERITQDRNAMHFLGMAVLNSGSTYSADQKLAALKIFEESRAIDDPQLNVLVGASRESDAQVRQAYFEFTRRHLMRSTDTFLFSLVKFLPDETDEALNREKIELIRWYTTRLCDGAADDASLEELTAKIEKRRAWLASKSN